MSRPDVTAALSQLPAIPRDAEGPVFGKPWHAEAFALAVALHARGVFEWHEWSEMLGRELRRLDAGGGADGEDGYYLAWLSALERLLDEREVVSEQERLARAEAWDRAAHATPHGEPIVLGRDSTGPTR